MEDKLNSMDKRIEEILNTLDELKQSIESHRNQLNELIKIEEEYFKVQQEDVQFILEQQEQLKFKINPMYLFVATVLVLILFYCIVFGVF